MRYMNSVKEELVQARRQGGTVVMSLKQFVAAGKFYLVRKQEDGSVLMREAEVRAKLR
jgi:hypothetical protein